MVEQPTVSFLIALNNKFLLEVHHNTTNKVLRPISGTVTHRLAEGDSVFIVQWTEHGFKYNVHKRMVLTFRGELLN